MAGTTPLSARSTSSRVVGSSRSFAMLKEVGLEGRSGRDVVDTERLEQGAAPRHNLVVPPPLMPTPALVPMGAPRSSKAAHQIPRAVSRCCADVQDEMSRRRR
jgi:hypothetical protein